MEKILQQVTIPDYCVPSFYCIIQVWSGTKERLSNLSRSKEIKKFKLWNTCMFWKEKLKLLNSILLYLEQGKTYPKVKTLHTDSHLWKFKLITKHNSWFDNTVDRILCSPKRLPSKPFPQDECMEADTTAVQEGSTPSLVGNSTWHHDPCSIVFADIKSAR